MKIGRRLATKLLNASRFALGFPEPTGEAGITETLDRAMLAVLDDVIEQATSALESFEYTAALERVERFFWFFCDDYLELVKQRAYDGEGGAPTQSARLALRSALSSLQRLLAPYLPYCTEEAWSWWHDDSVHTIPWPVPLGAGGGGAADVAALASAAIGAIRKAKSDARQSMRAPVDRVRIEGPAGAIETLRSIADDLRAAGNVGDLQLEPSAGELHIDVAVNAS
jgi:valyl-tRNA synthetase